CQIGNKFRRRLEEFLARGGRVVLVQPEFELKSQSQGWEVGNKWDRTAQAHSPGGAPDLRAMSVDSEMMYVATDAPWLQTDAQWTALYSRVAGENANADTPR